MAYMLFKYIRRKVKESGRKEAALNITDNSHLTPEFHHGAPEPEEHESLPGNATQHTPTEKPISAESHHDSRKLNDEARKMRAYRWRMILGLILPSFLASVDVTIVAPAIPTISSHFNHLSGSFNWIVAAYTLTFTTFVPASGQIADIYGRHFALQFQMFWILIGSVLCASAVTWPMLLFGRALQGMGAAGIMNLTRIVLSDGVSLADNSKNNTIFSLINGVSYAIGPVIGGYLTASSWRYCFVVPIPIAVISHVLIFFLMRKDLAKGRVTLNPGDSRRTGYITGLGIIDWIGMITFILGVGLLILAVQWGGTQYAWSSSAVIIPFVAGGVLFLYFFFHEYLLGAGRFISRIFPHQIPMIPSAIFRKKDTTLLMVINFSAGVSLVSAFYFVSYYWQLAEGYSSSKAGIQLLYYTPGLGVGVYTAMFLCNVWPRQTFQPLFWGSIVEAAGLSLLTWAVSMRQTTLVNVFLAVAGAGTGMRFMPIVLHAAGIWPSRIPAIQSLLSFTLPLGETIGISMMGAVFGNKFDQYLRAIELGSGSAFTSSTGPANLDSLQSLGPAAREAVQNAAARAVMWAFISVIPFVGVSLVAACFLGNVWIGKAAKVGDDGRVVREERKSSVVGFPYLLALFSGGMEGRRREVNPAVDQREAGKERVPDEETADLRRAQNVHVRDAQ
ncbi:MFS general substrate transporter [Lentithecium fluviatile CBS 122367]|uniref:MFS general substrate transporter n=1 Tax=Lentithecium fluviatile CBS 122367 TaxID=1168545 RepID=A0A6G1JKT6_9PLEO|nr:MFS general substrate transporter [Lentithecium fluviatile CBS 122367]